MSASHHNSPPILARFLDSALRNLIEISLIGSFIGCFLLFRSETRLLGVILVCVPLSLRKLLNYWAFDQTSRQCPNCGGYRSTGRRILGCPKPYYYDCGLCHYEWQWTPGEPYPPITLQPGLIRAGSDAIAAEERSAAATASNNEQDEAPKRG